MNDTWNFYAKKIGKRKLFHLFGEIHGLHVMVERICLGKVGKRSSKKKYFGEVKM